MPKVPRYNFFSLFHFFRVDSGSRHTCCESNILFLLLTFLFKLISVVNDRRSPFNTHLQVTFGLQQFFRSICLVAFIYSNNGNILSMSVRVVAVILRFICVNKLVVVVVVLTIVTTSPKVDTVPLFHLYAL